MKHSAEFRRCLLDVDVVAVRRLWRHVSPHLAQPQDDDEARATIHYARTQATSIPLKARAWSHKWLLDHGLPSGLPDALKPKAERFYPRIVEGTGFATGGSLALPVFEPLRATIHTAVEAVILDEYSGRVVNHDLLRGRIQETVDRTIRRELGRGVALPRQE